MADPSALSIFVSGMTGLVGALVGAVATTIQQRKTDERKLKHERQRESDRLQHKAEVLRAILRSELRNLIGTFRGEKNFVSDRRNEYTWVPTIGYFKEMSKNISSLGILSHSEAERVMDAYYTYCEHVWYILKNSS